jgi:hypothetical protein
MIAPGGTPPVSSRSESSSVDALDDGIGAALELVVEATFDQPAEHRIRRHENHRYVILPASSGFSKGEKAVATRASRYLSNLLLSSSATPLRQIDKRFRAALGSRRRGLPGGKPEAGPVLRAR